MPLNFKEITQQNGGWFKPADYKDAYAILVEVTSFDRQRPTPNGPKDSVLCDITVFPSAATIESQNPEIIKGTRIEQTVLARDLSDLVGSATVVTLDQVASKKPGQHPAWVWRTANRTVRDEVVKYVEAREAAVAEAIADAPDF